MRDAMRKEAAKREIKQERAARTRVEIMEAAITLFARRGILATTMAELAKAIRMTPGALYWHFPTKEDLLLAAIEELHERFLHEFKELLEQQRRLTARHQFEAFIGRTQQFLRYHREYGIFFGMVAAESAYMNDRVAEAIREKLGMYVAVLENIIRYGQNKTKEFRTDVDANVTAHAVFGGFMGALLHQNLFRESVAYDPSLSTLQQLTADGITTRR
ncbi:TetR/AcrR family transcriptional regulator [Archangium sp.]|uniref:TetR/AcrR family transcriptional regulator n=1 Tax=Archangium sp. TaxID=1872627 RepID=UPI002D6545D5|nr:TetR family transcriptional regulator [Archangium sp.]HYO54818.1 TetR family transcriptional regulator [Archangium sp.]